MKTVFILFLSLSLALADEPDLEKFSSASRKFSSAVYNEILTDNKVTVGSLVSSFSLETILALTEAGAKDATATEIQTSLSLPETEKKTQALMKVGRLPLITDSVASFVSVRLRVVLISSPVASYALDWYKSPSFFSVIQSPIGIARNRSEAMKGFLVFIFSVAAAVAADVDLTEFAESNKQFTAAVYDEILVDNKENILVSPFSVETVLALTQSGAVGKTGEEIRASLFLPETQEETESLVKTVLPTLVQDDIILHTANKIYVEEGLEIKEAFKKTATDVYQAAFQNIEFAENVDAAAEINKWVEEETEDKIHDLINSDDVDESTRVVLVNALYFQGNWSLPFEPVSTKKAAFYISNDKTVDTETMYQRSEEYNFFESTDLDAKFLELPFRGADASMVIILPNKNEGIGILEKQMKSALVTPKFAKEFVEVSVPKFKIESTVDFKDVLQKLGVRSAFNPDTADFSGIAGSPGEILISKIVQKTFIDVNEMGVEAAAATAVVAPTSVNPDADKTFIVDHPFAFYIQVNGIVLFEGRVLEPSY